MCYYYYAYYHYILTTTYCIYLHTNIIVTYYYSIELLTYIYIILCVMYELNIRGYHNTQLREHILRSVRLLSFLLFSNNLK